MGRFYVLVYPSGYSHERRAGVYRTTAFIPNGRYGSPFPMQFGPFETAEEANAFFCVMQPAVVAHSHRLISGGPSDLINALEAAGVFAQVQSQVESSWYFAVVYGHRVAMHFTDAEARQNLAGSQARFRQAGVFDNFSSAFRFLLTRGAWADGRREWSPDLTNDASHTAPPRATPWNPSHDDVPFINPDQASAMAPVGSEWESITLTNSPAPSNVSPTRPAPDSPSTPSSSGRGGVRGRSVVLEEITPEEASRIVSSRLGSAVNLASPSGLGPFRATARVTPQPSPSRHRQEAQRRLEGSRPENSASRSDVFTTFLLAYHGAIRIPIENALLNSYSFAMFLNAANFHEWNLEASQLQYIWNFYGSTIGHSVPPSLEEEPANPDVADDEDDLEDLYAD